MQQTQMKSSHSKCPECDSPLAGGEVTYCTNCDRMYDHGGRCLNQSDGYYYNFSMRGSFELLDSIKPSLSRAKVPHPVRLETANLCEKIFSHLGWMGLWTIGIYFLPKKLVPVFLTLMIINLFLLGCRLTTLMIYGKVKELLFPPLWERLTKELFKQPSLETLKKYGLDKHPGFLTNLGLATLSKGNKEGARDYFIEAATLCPSHPLITEFQKATLEIHSTP